MHMPFVRSTRSIACSAILYFGLDFYLPLSKVDENMKRAHRRNAILEQKFFFRTTISELQYACVRVL